MKLTLILTSIILWTVSAGWEIGLYDTPCSDGDSYKHTYLLNGTGAMPCFKLGSGSPKGDVDCFYATNGGGTVPCKGGAGQFKTAKRVYIDQSNGGPTYDFRIGKGSTCATMKTKKIGGKISGSVCNNIATGAFSVS